MPLLELYTDVATYLDIDSAESLACMAMSEEILRHRLNPLRYLSPVFEDPVFLLKAMTSTGSIISGSRALEYFVPGSVDEDSDWDFYTAACLDSIGPMASCLETLGVKWDSYIHGSDLIEPPEGYHGLELSLLKGELTHHRTGRRYRIQLIWKEKQTAVQCVVSFHSSVVQCFLAGFGAVSMYHNLTTKRQSYYWEGNDARHVNPPQESIVVTKYKSRGFSYIGYPTNTLKKRGPKIRYMTDESCKKISFTSYLSFVNKSTFIALELHLSKGCWWELISEQGLRTKYARDVMEMQPLTPTPNVGEFRKEAAVDLKYTPLVRVGRVDGTREPTYTHGIRGNLPQELRLLDLVPC